VKQPLAALAALGSGTLFGIGLAVAQMTDPRKVLGFLDIAGAWDASLLFVMGGGASLALVGYFLVLKRRLPVLDAAFHLPTRIAIDRPLLIGSALFGIGWGLAGYCPGPAISSLGLGNAEALWFLPALFSGFALQRWRRQPGV
jgi:uncharacterized membrane protein YedE/YeeE